MKLLTLTIATALMMSGPVLAEETKASSTDTAFQAIAGKEKKSRKKKVEMCAECGKPESECDCPGYEHKKDGKEAAKKDGKKDDHKEGDGHSH